MIGSMHTNKKSTETALLELTERLDCGQYALAVFFDIEGAFDKRIFANVEQTLIERGINILTEIFETKTSSKFAVFDIR
jgi:hypothetical protein